MVDGRWQAVGSDRAAIDGLLAKARHRRASVPVVLAVDQGSARIKIGASVDGVGTSVLLIGFDHPHSTKVARGENAGRRLISVNVVRGFGVVGRFAGGMTEIGLPIPWRSDRIAALVQGVDGRILGAAVADARTP